MENSTRLGLMAVVAVSGSMVFLVHQVHKRLLSNFMEKFEYEYAHDQKNLSGSEKHEAKKVRFAKETSKNKSCGDKKMITTTTRVRGIKAEEIWVMENVQKWRHVPKLEDMMPPNRAVLYRGIMKYRNRTINRRLHF
ncbi:uncharacterized protein LOC109807247 [Cajanus cajan]|uniref:Uncharacterized protein n=1 Tax=Cajanus cajan TaxID=3821 RepID=A0A151SQ63_CAJCA|nr:uncharacterized protein LOC109807247 [Cajanus cajan]KYP56980.1 hypothetical protein KK1_003231 [Cajanus cajan]